MKPTQRVVWTEGMFMAPQHMQQQDLYHERMLEGRLSALTPYDWGVVESDLDAGALGKDQIKVTHFRGVLPDGLLLGFEEGDAEAAPVRPIAGHFAANASVLEVFLAVLKERDGVPSTQGTQGPADAPAAPTTARSRFRAATRPIADLTGDGAQLGVTFGQRNVVILFGDEARDDYDAIKITELVRDQAGSLLVNEAYIPPVLRIGASGFLMSSARRLLAMMLSRQRQLAEERRQRDGSSVEFSASDITRFLQLNSLNTSIPILNHIGENGDLGALDLYLLLVQVAGQFSTFSTDTDPSKFPKFTYTDLRATFEELLALITYLLRSTVHEVYVTVPMEVKDGVHVGKLDDQRLLRCQQYVLTVRSDLPEDQITQRMPGLCKMSSWNQLPYIMRAATPGVPITVTHRPPAEVPIKAGVIYFTLNLASEHWRHIQDERAVAIFLPPPFDPSRVKIELLGIPPKATR